MDAVMKLLAQFNVSLGTWAGVPLRLHWSWTLLFFWVAAADPSGAALFLSIYFLVVLHEYGHVMAARRCGTRTASIDIFYLGGVASMDIPRDPLQELFIAAAGPAVNGLLAFPLYWLLDAHPFVWDLFRLNLTLLIFNLLPAFPLDGGRILRAALTILSGNRLWATRNAVNCGYAFAAGFAVVGLLTFNFMLAFIGLLIWAFAAQELAQALAEADVGLPPQLVDRVPDSDDA